jgi:hypothetical protein
VNEESARWQRLALSMAAVVVLVVVLVARSFIISPSDGLPDSRTSCEQSHSTARTIGEGSWCG